MDRSSHYLGRLCTRGHDHEGTGQSLRRSDNANHLGLPPGPGYEIEHIVLPSAFDLTDPAQVAEACRPSNHQWLTTFENRSKGGIRRAS